jgi:hypothetical protein
MKKLYDAFKDRLKDAKGVISDNEMLLLNRRDFLFSETSTTAAFLRMFGAENVTYEMYAIIDFLHASLCKIRPPTKVRIFQLSQSMTLPSLAVSALVGDLAGEIRAHAPRGLQKIGCKDEFAKALANRFEAQLNSGLHMADLGQDDDTVDILFCNASNEAEVSSALKSFERVKRGMILIKGYGKANAPNCGEIILESRLNVHCSLAGFGYCLAI